MDLVKRAVDDILPERRTRRRIIRKVQELSGPREITIHRSTLQRYLREANLISARPRSMPYLGESTIDKRKPFATALLRIEAAEEGFLKKIVFSDEKYF